jgi:hypothetical protein
MKNISFVFALIMFPFVVFSQAKYQDLVYLKDGRLVKGKIVENSPAKGVQIILENGPLAFFKSDEIDRFGKEKYREELVEKKSRPCFVGLTVGWSEPLGSYAKKSDAAATAGMHVNMANAGYVISERWGVSALFFVAVNDYKTFTNPFFNNGIQDGYKWNVKAYKGALIGPMYTAPLSKRVLVDARIVAGYANFSIVRKVLNNPTNNWLEPSDSESITTGALSVGGNVRYNFSSRFALIATAEYFYSSPKFTIANETYRQPISTLNIGVGVAYRLSRFGGERAVSSVVM